MNGHALAIVYFAALIFQLGCVFGMPKDERPWNAARRASLAAGLVGVVAAIWLAVNAL